MIESTTSKNLAPRGCFAETRWSLVCSLQSAPEPDRHRALDEFCEIYWYPLYLFARRKGYSAEDSEDLTQALFQKLLGGEGLQRLDPDKGRVRSFLLQSLRNLMAGEWKKSQAQRRGAGIRHVSIDAMEGEARFQAEPFTEVTPESEFERHFACALLQQTALRLKEEFAKAGRARVFAALSERIGGEGSKPYSQLSTELGMTVSAIKVTVHRMRGRFKNLLIEEICETVTAPEELDDEIAHLCQVFA
ncbi:MAG: RNA polymerase sigma factor (sigma-70 family) [Verrucomicrobiales bacterium]